MKRNIFIKLVGAILIGMLSIPGHAAFMSYCMNFATSNPVSSSFESCVNRNFERAQRMTNDYLFINSCHNFSSTVSFGYTSCIQRNFNEVARALPSGTFLQYCSNFSRTSLDQSFISCVNRNFSTIERELRRF